MKIILLSFITLFIWAISNSQTLSPVSKKEFTKVMHLKAENVHLDHILYKPEKIALSDSKLLILDEGSETYFQVFSYPNLVFSDSYGEKGPRPNEIGFAPTLSYFNENIIEYFDFQHTALYDIYLNKNNQQKNIKNDLVLNEVLPPEFVEVQTAVKLTDKVIFGSGVREGKLVFFDIKTGIFNYKPFTPKNDKIPAKHKYIIYSGSVTCRPDKKLVLFASKHFDNFEIYEANGSNVVTYLNDSQENQVFMKQGKITSDETKLYYTSVYATNNYFYLVSMGGKSTKDLLILIDKGKFVCEIQQYDWEGKPINSYIINRPVKTFCVDEKLRSIFVIDLNSSEENPLVKFNY